MASPRRWKRCRPAGAEWAANRWERSGRGSLKRARQARARPASSVSVVRGWGGRAERLGTPSLSRSPPSAPPAGGTWPGGCGGQSRRRAPLQGKNRSPQPAPSRGFLVFEAATQNRCPASWASHPRRARDGVGGRCWGDGLGDSQHQGSAWGDGTGEAGIRGRHRAGHGGGRGGRPWTMALGAGMRDPEWGQHRGRGWEGQHWSGRAH